MPASSSAEDKARILLALLTNQLTLDELETAYPDDGPEIRALYERLERVVPELFEIESTPAAETEPPCPYTEPVSRLLTLGPPEEKWREPWLDLPALCGLTREDIPELLRLVNEPDLDAFRDEFPAAGFGPRYAWRALGQLGDEAAIAPLLSLFADEYTYEIGDTVCQVFSRLGEPAIAPLEEMLVDRGQSEYAHLLAVQCLRKIGEDHVYLRERCAWSLGTLLGRYREQPAELNAELVWGLAELEAKSYLPLIEEAYAAGAVDVMTIGLDSVRESFDPPRESYVPSFRRGVDIFHHFLPLPAPLLPLHEPVSLPPELAEAAEESPELTGLTKFPPALPALSDQPPVIVKATLPAPGGPLSPPEVLLALEEPEHGVWPDYGRLGLEPTHIPPLIKIATDDSLYAQPYDTPQGRAPYHAIRALARLGAAEALESLLPMLQRHPHDDALHDEFPWACGLWGAAAIPYLAAALPDLASSEETWYHCATVSESLAGIGRAHPDAREQCAAVLHRQLTHFADQPQLVNTFLIHSLVQLQLAGSSLLLQQVWETPGAYDREYSMDWFEMQAHLGIWTLPEAEEQRRLYECYRDWKVFKGDFWPGRDTGWLWPEERTLPLVDSSNDFDEQGRIDLPRVRVRAARWAYSLLDGWRFGPFALLAMETTGHAQEPEIVQLGLINEVGRVLLDTYVRPEKEILPQATAYHGITNDMVAGAPSFCDLYPQLKQFLRGRILIIYDWERQGQLLRDSMDRCSSSRRGIGMRDLGAQYAYFYGVVHPDGWPLQRQLLGNACLQQGIAQPSQRSVIGHCRAMLSLIYKMAHWLTDYETYQPQPPYRYAVLGRSYKKRDWLAACGDMLQQMQVL